MKPIYLISAAISFMFPVVAHAELKWEQTTVELSPKFSDKQAVGHFKYQNAGDKPVHFKSVKASCGCTTAQTQKEQVAPGEKGEITATFNIGDRTGQQVKQVTVETDDSAHPVTVLTLKTNIPALLELQPNFVFWQSGEEGKSKTVVAKAGKDVPIKDLQVTSTSPQFDVKVDKGPDAGQFKINIQPKQTTSPAFATVTVKPDFPKEAPKTFYISARVTGAASPAAVAPQAPAAVGPPPPAAPVSTTPVAPATPGH